MKYYLLIFLLLTRFVSADEITLTSDEWCPYNCGENEHNKGFLVDMFSLIFNKAGHTVKYVVARSYDQAIKDVRSNKYDALIGTTPEEAPDFIFPKKPMTYTYDILIVPKKSSWEYTNADSLNSIILGAVKAYEYDEPLNTHIQKYKDNPKKVQLFSGNNYLKYSLRKLRYKQITAFIEDARVMKSYYKGRAFPFKVAGQLETYPLYIAFSPKHYKAKRYAKILTKGLKSLKGTPELQKLLKKYGLTENEIWTPLNQ